MFVYLFSRVSKISLARQRCNSWRCGVAVGVVSSQRVSSLFQLINQILLFAILHFFSTAMVLHFQSRVFQPFIFGPSPRFQSTNSTVVYDVRVGRCRTSLTQTQSRAHRYLQPNVADARYFQQNRIKDNLPHQSLLPLRLHRRLSIFNANPLFSARRLSAALRCHDKWQ